MSDLLERLRDMAAGKHDDLDVAAEAIEEIIDLNWRVVQLEDERDKLRAWKQETIERLVVQGILTAAHETDPKKAVHDMLSWQVTVALDPLVSSKAQALIEQGREELRAKSDELREENNRLYGLAALAVWHGDSDKLVGEVATAASALVELRNGERRELEKLRAQIAAHESRRSEALAHLNLIISVEDDGGGDLLDYVKAVALGVKQTLYVLDEEGK